MYAAKKTSDGIVMQTRALSISTLADVLAPLLLTPVLRRPDPSVGEYLVGISAAWSCSCNQTLRLAPAGGLGRTAAGPARAARFAEPDVEELAGDPVSTIAGFRLPLARRALDLPTSGERARFKGVDGPLTGITCGRRLRGLHRLDGSTSASSLSPHQKIDRNSSCIAALHHALQHAILS